MFEIELETLSKKLPLGTSAKEEEPFYDLMSDAFVWSDEVPRSNSLTQGELGALRGVWRYRTSIITGIRDERFKELWQRLWDAAPNWAGFAANRSSFSERFAEQFRSIKNKPRGSGFNV